MSTQQKKSLCRTAIINKPQDVLFLLVSDVRRYPEFVPYCREVDLVSNTSDEFIAAFRISIGPIHLQLRTRNRPDPPHAIEIELVDGPFEFLRGHWRFLPIGETGTSIELAFEYQLSGSLRAMFFETVLGGLASQLVDAFVARAKAVAAADILAGVAGR